MNVMIVSINIVKTSKNAKAVLTMNLAMKINGNENMNVGVSRFAISTILIRKQEYEHTKITNTTNK